jgi:hypothetical protein
MYKRDSYVLGILIGLVLPLILYGVILLVLSFWGQVDGWLYVPRPEAPLLFSVFANLLPFRYYMVNLKADRTGRGLLLITFILVLSYFAFF